VVDSYNSPLLEFLTASGDLLPGEDSVLISEVEQFSSIHEQEHWLFLKVLQKEGVNPGFLVDRMAEAEGIASMHAIPEGWEGPPIRSTGLVDCATSIRFGVVPVEEGSGRVLIACTYPINFELEDSLSHLLECRVDWVMVTPGFLKTLRFAVYASGMEADRWHPGEDVTEVVSAPSAPVPTISAPSSVDEGPVREYVDWVIEEAIKRRASDIHWEPMDRRFRIRCRVDGALVLLDEPAPSLHASVTSRVKLMAQLDIAEKRLPQDGRFHTRVGEGDFDFRVSTIPSTHGEGIVLRILDKHKLSIGLDELGMSEEQRVVFERVITAPDGIFLVTGPTGSGKSTSLYAALNHINNPGVKIITVEDPVEYHLEGINQVQVRPETGMTFGAALRAILRQSPNVIMVGEIRDLETAEIAINASLTGHTVFSTLHTNDAPGAVTRLVDIGAKPFLVAAALRAVLAQRLVRRIKPQQQIPYVLSGRELFALGPEYEALRGSIFFHAGESGNQFLGRVGIFELFEMTESLGEIIYRGGTLIELKSLLKASGFSNMRYDGVRKALAGITTLEEVLATTVSEMAAFPTRSI
jgi:type IV pilus assembly protein PilB